jgi:hypothetical protein
LFKIEGIKKYYRLVQHASPMRSDSCQHDGCPVFNQALLMYGNKSGFENKWVIAGQQKFDQSILREQFCPQDLHPSRARLTK